MRRTRLTLLFALAAMTLAACGSDSSPSSGAGGESAPGEELLISTDGWETDFSKHSVPLSEFTSGGPSRDGIPPIDDPKFVSQDEAEEWLGDREPVIVVEEGETARAYPVQILIWHEIVNDTLADRPISVTYCPLCNSAVAFDRRVDDRELTFGTTGNLRRSDLVMWDRQTESWWQQLTAEAVVGELTGKRLEVIPSQTLSWEDFREIHPEGDVLSRDTGHSRDYGSNPYRGYDDPDTQPFLFDGETDDRLPPKERVAAVFGKNEVVVVPFSRLVDEPVVNERVGGTEAVVIYKKGTLSPLDAAAIEDSRDVGTAAAFDRRIGGRLVDLEPAGEGRFRDAETGSVFDMSGRADGGSLDGQRLTQLRHDEQFWFALAAFLPDARISG